MAAWTQPTLGGSSVKAFALLLRFDWPVGWHGRLDVTMEGEHDPSTLAKFSELQTPEMMDAVATAMEMLRVLILND